MSSDEENKRFLDLADERRKIQAKLNHPTPSSPDFADKMFTTGFQIVILVVVLVVVVSFVVFLFYSGLFEIYDETTKSFETPEETIERYDSLIEDNKDAKGNIFNPSKWMKDIATDKKENLEFEINVTYEDWVNKGMSLSNLGKYEEAIQSFDKAIEINPEEYVAWYGKGRLLQAIDRYEEAIQSYNTAHELDSENFNVLANRAYSLFNLGKYDEAIQNYDKAIEINPEHATAWANRGFALEKLGKYEEAVQSYDKTIEINPDYPNIKQQKNNLESLILQNP